MRQTQRGKGGKARKKIGRGGKRSYFEKTREKNRKNWGHGREQTMTHGGGKAQSSKGLIRGSWE